MDYRDFIGIAMFLAYAAGAADGFFQLSYVYHQKVARPVGSYVFVISLMALGQLPALFSISYMHSKIYHFADIFAGLMSAAVICVIVFGIVPLVLASGMLRLIAWYMGREPKKHPEQTAQ